MKILISGGKTGGHLIPGIALYEEFRKRGIECHYILSPFDIENFPITNRIAPENRSLIELRGISRKLSLKTPLYLLKIIGAFFKIFGSIWRYQPDVVLITGGYISNPVALSALLLGKPLYIAEQNSVAGITNRFYARFAKRIFTTFPNPEKIPSKKAMQTGNPSIFHEKTDPLTAKNYFGLGDYPFIIGVSGGSQGAKKLNNAVYEILERLKVNRVGVIWSLGSVDYERMKKEELLQEIEKRYPNVRTYQFIERMDYLFSAVDLVISRAGATSISEFIHFQTPSVLIPIKNSPDNHQHKNASFISENHAGLILTEDNLTAASLLESIETIRHHKEDYLESIHALKERYYRENPETLIVNTILQDREKKKDSTSA